MMVPKLLTVGSTRPQATPTSARPASLKAIQTAEKNPTEATIKAAAAEMRKHLAELEKSSKSEKTFPAFKKGLEDVIKKTEALI